MSVTVHQQCVTNHLLTRVISRNPFSQVQQSKSQKGMDGIVILEINKLERIQIHFIFFRKRGAGWGSKGKSGLLNYQKFGLTKCIRELHEERELMSFEASGKSKAGNSGLY